MIFNAGQRRGVVEPVLPPKGQPLSQYTWAEIDAISRAGVAAEYFLVGDQIPVPLQIDTGNIMEIVGFSHDDKADGTGKAGISFVSKTSLNDTKKMNTSSATNVGGWSDSYLRSFFQNTLLGRVPAEVAAVIKPVLKKTTKGNQAGTIITSTDLLWVPSEQEMTGAASGASASEGIQYPRFATAASRIKTVQGTAAAYWLRSPALANRTNFRKINASGDASGGAANTDSGVVFGFCV